MTGPCGVLLGHLRRTLGAQVLAGLPDGQLLRQFAAGGSQAECAFEMLVRRHGPMVLRTCRAATHDGHDAEDAFQATFLILVRRAGTLAVSDSVGPWLFGVARRVCARARADAVRRRARELSAATEVESSGGGGGNEAIAIVHDEVGRLPAALRAAVVLCDLEGLTYQEAAERLGWSHDTVRGRLARARQRLRLRLTRLGLGPAAFALLPPPELSRALVAATTQAAAVFSGQTTGTVSGSVLLLVNGGFQSMFLLKFKSAVLTLVAAGAVAAGAVGLNDQARTPQPQPAKTQRGGDAEELWVATDQFRFTGTLQIDLLDRIIELALQAKRQMQADKTADAVRSLHQLEQIAHEWSKQLEAGPAHGVVEQKLKGQLLEKRLWEAEPLWVAEKSQPAPAADVEKRLREVEQKLDRILKAFGDTTEQRRGGVPRGGARRGGGGGEPNGE